MAAMSHGLKSVILLRKKKRLKNTTAVAVTRCRKRTLFPSFWITGGVDVGGNAE